MPKIGSWWLASHEAQPGEQVVWSCLANRTQSTNRAVGGKLYLTARRLLFCPHLFDYVLDGKKWEASLREIRTVDKQPKGSDTYGGGLRDRLRVRLQDGSVNLFVVNKLDQVIDRLQAAVIEAGGGPSMTTSSSGSSSGSADAEIIDQLGKLLEEQGL